MGSVRRRPAAARRARRDIVTGGAGAKRAFLRASLRLLHRRVPLHISNTPPLEPERERGHIVLMHGWGLDADSLSLLAAALGRVCPQRRIWHITYDTNWTAWQTSARAILAELRSRDTNWDDTILVGYSMGGIVARSLVAQGFDARGVVTLCSPHAGPLPYLIFPGPRSLSAHNGMMRALDRHPLDIAARSRLHCLAIDYQDLLGPHEHDGMVNRSSALALHLGEIGSRHCTRLHYKNAAWYDPHWRGKDPKFLPAALEAVAALDGDRAPDYSDSVLRGYRKHLGRRKGHQALRRAQERAQREALLQRAEQKVPARTAQRGDLLLFRKARGLNRLITWFTRSQFYHVGLYEGDGWIIEARPRGVVRRNLRGPDGDRHFVAIPFARVASQEQAEAALRWAQQQIGDDYDPFEVMAQVAERMFRCMRIPYASPDKFSCGEFVTQAWREAGIDLFPSRDASRVVPSDFERYLRDG